MGHPDFEFVVLREQVVAEATELMIAFDAMSDKRKADMTPEMMFLMGIEAGITLAGGDIDNENYEDEEFIEESIGA